MIQLIRLLLIPVLVLGACSSGIELPSLEESRKENINFRYTLDLLNEELREGEKEFLNFWTVIEDSLSEQERILLSKDSLLNKELNSLKVNHEKWKQVGLEQLIVLQEQLQQNREWIEKQANENRWDENAAKRWLRMRESTEALCSKKEDFAVESDDLDAAFRMFLLKAGLSFKIP